MPSVCGASLTVDDCVQKLGHEPCRTAMVAKTVPVNKKKILCCIVNQTILTKVHFVEFHTTWSQMVFIAYFRSQPCNENFFYFPFKIFLICVKSYPNVITCPELQ